MFLFTAKYGNTTYRVYAQNADEAIAKIESTFEYGLVLNQTLKLESVEEIEPSDNPPS